MFWRSAPEKPKGQNIPLLVVTPRMWCCRICTRPRPAKELQWSCQINLGEREPWLVQVKTSKTSCYPGLRHFKNGISHVSQWTGREHKDMQRVFVGLLVSAVQPAILQTARAAIDFIYYSQLHIHTSTTLNALQDTLRIFHENKDIFVCEGVRKHFNIPKLHQMLHHFETIKSHGAADGCNTESPECLHIDFAKEAYRASNGRDYEEQMVKWLRCQEAVANTSIALQTWQHTGVKVFWEYFDGT